MPLKMGVELGIHHLVNHRETTEVRHAEQAATKAVSLPVRVPLQGLMIQRSLYYL